MSSKPIPQGSFVMLWAGENPALHWVLLERLQAADIPFSDKALGDDQVTLTADPLPIDWKPRFGFEVAVLSLDVPAAKEILEKLLDEDLENVEIPAQDGAPLEERPAAMTTERHTTVEVWSGEDHRTAQFLTAAMRENEIPIDRESLGERSRICVSAANEKRAREIVREIVEAAPPE
jgi:hypothetical protein